MNKLIIIYTIVFFCCFTLFIQRVKAQTNIDSLEHDLILSEQIDTLHINKMNFLAFELILNANYSKSSYYLNTAIQKALLNNYYKGLATSLNYKGLINYYQTEYEKALIYYNLSSYLNLLINDHKGLASIYSNISMVFQQKGDFTNALYYNLKSLKLRQLIKDENLIAISYNNIGSTYHYLGILNKALEFYKKALIINLKLKNETSLIYSYSNLALVYYDLGKKMNENKKNIMFDSSLFYNQKTLLLEKKYNDFIGLSITYNNLASIYADKNQIQKALEFYNLAKQFQELINDEKGLSLTYYNLANYHYKNKNSNQSIYLCKKSLNIALKTKDIKQQTICYKLLYDIYNQIGNNEEALKYNLQHSILSEKHYSNILEQKVDFLQKIYDNNIIEFKKLSDEMSSAKTTLKSNKIILWIIFSFFILVLILSILLNKNYKKKKLAFKLLTTKNSQILFQNSEINKKNELLNKIYLELEYKNNNYLSSLRYAKQIQETIFPIESKLENLEIPYFLINLPKDIVSGDFIWMKAINEEELIIAVVDCTGHGVPGALLSIIGNTILNQIVVEQKTYNPALILEKMQEKIVEIFKNRNKEIEMGDGMDVCLCRIDKNIKLITFAGANRLLFCFKENNLEIFKGEKIPIGGFFKSYHNLFNNHHIKYYDEITIYLTTDGYIDQMNINSKRIGNDKFCSILKSIQNKSIAHQKEILLETLKMHQNEEDQTDDILIFALKLN